MFFDAEGARIVNLQGGYEMKDLIRKKLPKELGFHPLNALVMLIGQWLTERGKILKIIPDAGVVGKGLEYDAIASNLDLRFENRWHVMGKEELERLVKRMTPRQHEMFDNLSAAWNGLRFHEGRRKAVSEQNPFALSQSPEVVERLVAVGRYAVRKHLPGLGPIQV